MFKVFFPSSRFFFLSVIIWAILNIALWHLGGKSWGVYVGWAPNYINQELAIDISRFWSPSFLWFYIWFLVATALFAGFWRIFSENKWQNWSILGSAFILFNIWLSVQVSVAINAWYAPFWDLVQEMLDKKGGDITRLYSGTSAFLWIAMGSVTISVINTFFVSHYIFRWRTAMNERYTRQWKQLRHIEGASQRVQEDAMRFATIMEDLGVKFIESIMTLMAFLPILVSLSHYVTQLPFIGNLPYALVWAALFWSLLGTLLLLVVGIKLPGLQFNNQRVEAAYRKELVYGEDHADRAEPLALKGLFENVRKNYFNLYFHYSYFNLIRNWYLQIDNIFCLLILCPSIASGLITLGLIQQIMNVFGQVSYSFQYLVNSWKTIIELLSIRKRLKAFEDVIN